MNKNGLYLAVCLEIDLESINSKFINRIRAG